MTFVAPSSLGTTDDRAHLRPRPQGRRPLSPPAVRKPRLVDIHQSRRDLGLAAMRDGAIGETLPIVQIRCVFVDDNRAFLEAGRAALEREGISVEAVATTSAEALRQVEAVHPDVVLVDIFLGEESGLDLARQLTDEGGTRGRTVILISTHAEDDVARLVADIPASFLSKAELTGEAIRRVLEARTR